MTTATAGLAVARGAAVGSGYPAVYAIPYAPVTIVSLSSGATFDSVGPSSSGASATSGTTLSWTHTPSGTPTAVLAAVAVGISTGGADSHGTCTYGGTAMTWLGWVHSANVNSGYAELFGLAGPPPGAQTVAYSATTTGTVTSLIGGSLAYRATGTTLATAFGTPVTAFGTAATGSVAVTGSSAQNRVAGAFASGTGSQAVTAGTLRWIRNLNASSDAGNSLGSDIPSAAGTVTLSGSWTSAAWGGIAVEVLASGNVTAPAGLATCRGIAQPSPGGSVLTSFTSTPGLGVPGLATPGATGILTSTLTTAVTATPGIATATGIAGSLADADVATAGLATGTGTAQAATVTTAVIVTSGLATGTGTAGFAIGSAPAGLATATGVAQQPAAITAGGTTADATVATVTGTAPAAPLLIVVTAGLATGTGTAGALADTDVATAGLATATGTAQPIAYFHAPAGLATGTGTAGLARGQGANAATGTGIAQPATVSTAASVTAHPGVATATGTAQGTAPRAMMLLLVGPASVSVTVGQVNATLGTGATGLNPGIAVGTQTSRSIIIGNTGSAGEGGP